MDEASKKTKGNLFNFIRSLNATEMSVLAANFIKQSGEEITKSVKALSQKWYCSENKNSYMVSITMQGKSLTGYGRNEEEAFYTAYKNLFESIINNDSMIIHLSNALRKITESTKNKKPPKASKNPTSSHEKSKLTQNSIDLNRSMSRQNTSFSGSTIEEGQPSRSKLRQILGKSFADQEPPVNDLSHSFASKGGARNDSKSRENSRYKHRDNSRGVITEPHQCFYRDKYKKYKEEANQLSSLVDQLRKKLKKYHEENKVLKSKLESYQDLEEADITLSPPPLKEKSSMNRVQSRDKLREFSKELGRRLSKKDLELDADAQETGLKKYPPTNHGQEEKENNFKSYVINQAMPTLSQSKSLAQGVILGESKEPDPLEDARVSLHKLSEYSHPPELVYEPDTPGQNNRHNHLEDSKEKKRKVSVPRLKLETLPGYHGNFNKSLNHLFEK